MSKCWQTKAVVSFRQSVVLWRSHLQRRIVAFGCGLGVTSLAELDEELRLLRLRLGGESLLQVVLGGRVGTDGQLDQRCQATADNERRPYGWCGR